MINKFESYRSVDKAARINSLTNEYLVLFGQPALSGSRFIYTDQRGYPAMECIYSQCRFYITQVQRVSVRDYSPPLRDPFAVGDVLSYFYSPIDTYTSLR